MVNNVWTITSRKYYKQGAGVCMKKTLLRGREAQSPGATSGEQKKHLTGEGPED